MTVVMEPIQGPALWHGADLAADPSWRYQLSGTEQQQLLAVLRESKQSHPEILAMTRSDFPLESLGIALTAIRKELMHGRGFALIRGLPTSDLDPESHLRLAWGLGLWLGDAVPQNAAGHLIGHVLDQRLPNSPEIRLYQTDQPLSFHSDSCDVVGLLALRSALEGGESHIASAAALHNHLLAQSPDLLKCLHEEFYCDRFGEIPAGKGASYPVRIFNKIDGLLTCCGMDPDIRSAQRFNDVPRLSERQIAALDALQAAAQEHSLKMELRPGDLQLLHNHTVLHARAAYRDHPELNRRRHLLRIWLSMPEGRTLPAFLAERWGNIEPGTIRGGIRVPGSKPTLPAAPQH